MKRERRLITVKEAAAYLGISESHLYRMLKDGAITAIKIGSSWFFEYDKIDKWIDSLPPGRVMPDAPHKRKSPKN